MLRRSVRICEECGTERRITLLEQAVKTHDGKMVIGLFGEGRCSCPSYALDALDLEALEDTRQEMSESEDIVQAKDYEEIEELDEIDENAEPQLPERKSTRRKKTDNRRENE